MLKYKDHFRRSFRDNFQPLSLKQFQQLVRKILSGA